MTKNDHLPVEIVVLGDYFALLTKTERDFHLYCEIANSFLQTWSYGAPWLGGQDLQPEKSMFVLFFFSFNHTEMRFRPYTGWSRKNGTAYFRYLPTYKPHTTRWGIFLEEE